MTNDWLFVMSLYNNYKGLLYCKLHEKQIRCPRRRILRDLPFHSKLASIAGTRIVWRTSRKGIDLLLTVDSREVSIMKQSDHEIGLILYSNEFIGTVMVTKWIIIKTRNIQLLLYSKLYIDRYQSLVAIRYNILIRSLFKGRFGRNSPNSMYDMY